MLPALLAIFIICGILATAALGVVLKACFEIRAEWLAKRHFDSEKAIKTLPNDTKNKTTSNATSFFKVPAVSKPVPIVGEDSRTIRNAEMAMAVEACTDLIQSHELFMDRLAMRWRLIVAIRSCEIDSSKYGTFQRTLVFPTVDDFHDLECDIDIVQLARDRQNGKEGSAKAIDHLHHLGVNDAWLEEPNGRVL